MGTLHTLSEGVTCIIREYTWSIQGYNGVYMASYNQGVYIAFKLAVFGSQKHP